MYDDMGTVNHNNDINIDDILDAETIQINNYLKHKKV